MNFTSVNAARDTVDQLFNLGKFGQAPASKVFLEAVNNANRTLGQFSEGQAEELAVNQALTEVGALTSQAPEGIPREALTKFVQAAREALKNPNASNGGDSQCGIIGDTDVKGDMTGGAGVATETPAVSKDELAIIQNLRDKTTRQEQCTQAINQALSQFNCNLAAMFQVGEGLVPTTQIVTLPVVIQSVAK